MSKAKMATPTHDQLNELHAEAARLEAIGDGFLQQLRDAKAARDEAARAVHAEEVRALASGGTPQLAELTRAAHKAEAVVLEPWTARADAAYEAAAVKCDETQRYIEEHLDDLLEELRPAAETARSAMAAAFAAFTEAEAAYNGVRERVRELLGAASYINPRAIPDVAICAPSISVPGTYGDRSVTPVDMPLPLPRTGPLERRRVVLETGMAPGEAAPLSSW